MIRMRQDGSIDMGVLEINDIVDITLLQNFQDNFAVSMDCASVTVDRSGNPVTDPSSYSKFCDQYVHKSKIGDERCAHSHNRMGQEAARTGRPYVGQCHAGLIDFAAPIIVHDELIGTVLGGQLLSEKPKEDYYREVAKKIGSSEDGLVDAVKEIKVTEKRNINAAAEVLFIVVNTLAENGLAKIKLQMVAKQLANKFVDISATLEELAASAQSIGEQQKQLNQEIEQIGKFTREINGILKSISQIATNTMLLGFNSSIEAARAGEAGKGFAVVAREIQNLSESSKKTAENILQLTQQITTSIDSTLQSSQSTLYTTTEQTKAMENVSNAVQEIVGLADELDNMMKATR
ncbi:PocR ligand-binding domain-containing protein [Faecalispora anaeroviscerum]|uniref:PocR ligand-binding domain-containing protein n=1 Tax=Faecalispora anaeroviscerum TaxID=2991836 RepID=UPI0024B91592|nr:PocR ligand-binding domain-containing protein [Faecalispora anaeroviscerum]